MDAPECLHRGQLWQFSAQYGGWLAIKLLLFNHALVVDPDVAAASPRRKRRSSLKVWMDLCLVADIEHIQKEDGAVRRGSYSAASTSSQSAADLDKKFRFSVQTKHQTLQFAADTAVQRDEWLHCLLLARKLRAKQVEEPKMKSDGSRAFLRFASSGSEESEGEEENRPASAPVSWSEENALRSAQLLSQRSRPTAVQSVVRQTQSTRSPVSLVTLQVTATDANGVSVSTIIPVTEASKEQVSVNQVKVDAIKQLQVDLRRPSNEANTATPGLLKNILRRDADYFVLFLETTEQWLQDEERTIGHYIFQCASRRLKLSLRPANSMPQPTIELTIVGTKTKVSDLSQRSYTTYLIEVAFNGATWQLARRFKEFHLLNCHLKGKHPGVELPRFPPKHMYTPLKGDVVDQRKEQLEVFLKRALLHPLTSTDVLLMSFLGVVSTSRDRELGQSEKRVIHVTTLHDSVACGDIILFSCQFGASRLQRKFTGSKYDHVGIVVPGESRFLLRIMEATSEGIQVYSLKSRLMAYSREVSKSIVVRKVQAERTPELIEKLDEFVRSVDGNPYSILGILSLSGDSTRNMLRSAQGTHNSAEESDDLCSSDSSSCTSSTPTSPLIEAQGLAKSQGDKRKYFCSSLVASAWKEIGWLDTKRKSSSFWPGSFQDGGEVERLMATGISLGPETEIDCRIVEVGLATQS